MRIARELGVPPRMAKEITSSSDYTLLSASFEQEWHDNTILNYEFALLRRLITGLVQKPPGIDEELLSARIKFEKAFDWMTPEEQQNAINAAKKRARLAGFGRGGS